MKKQLRQGDKVADYGAGVDVVTLFRLGTGLPVPPAPDVYTPLHTWYGGRYALSPDKLLADPNRYTAGHLGARRSGEGTLIGVRFTDPRFDIARESWFDAQRGYLPVEYRESSKKGVHSGVIREAREFRPSRWFPTRLVAWGQTPAGKWGYSEVVVLELEVEKRPTTNDFTLTLPRGVQVHGLDANEGVYYLKQDERVSPDDLAELFEKLEKSKTDKRMDTAIEHKADRLSWWVWVAATGGAILILGGGYLWWRKRRLARRSA